MNEYEREIFWNLSVNTFDGKAAHFVTSWNRAIKKTIKYFIHSTIKNMLISFYYMRNILTFCDKT